MRSQPERRPWRIALAGGTLLVLGLGVVFGIDLKTAVTTQTASVTMPPVLRVVAPPAAPLAVAHAVAAPAPPHVTLVLTPGSPVTLVDPSDPSDVSRLRGRSLTLPVTGVSAAQLTDTYTQARAAGVPHEALDIMAPRGTPVVAIEDGRVAKLFLSKPGGITLYQFDPGGQYAYYYAHLDRYADGIAEGASLRKGQVIAYVGSTGNALPQAPHLHFAIFRLGPERQWWRGTPLNPFMVWRDAKP